MLTRVISLFIAALALGFSIFVFDAASSANTAANLIEAANNTQSANAKRLVLERVSPILNQAWSRPLAWHAGAMELQSGAFSGLAASPADPRLAQSAQEAARALDASPIQPLAWLRLGALSRYGASNDLCAPQQCLERSWAAGPVLELGDACLRLGLANAFGEHISANDRRIALFLATGPSARQISQCLYFLPLEQQFSLMLQSREHSIERNLSRQLPVRRADKRP